MASSFTVLVTGANRGLGLGLVRQLLHVKEVTKLFAGCRNPNTSQELKTLSDHRLELLSLDVTDDVSIRKTFDEVDGCVGPAGLNLLINNAGVLHDTPFDVPNRQLVTSTFDVNTTSPLFLAQTFLPLLRRAAIRNAKLSLGARRAAIVNISAQLGSITQNATGSRLPSGQNCLAYRASKVSLFSIKNVQAALNAITKSLSIDLKNDGILVVSQCPGWVQTEMGGQGAFFSTDESAALIVKNILNYDESHNGGFFSHTGKPYPY